MRSPSSTKPTPINVALIKHYDELAPEIYDAVKEHDECCVLHVADPQALRAALVRESKRRREIGIRTFVMGNPGHGVAVMERELCEGRRERPRNERAERESMELHSAKTWRPDEPPSRAATRSLRATSTSGQEAPRF